MFHATLFYDARLVLTRSPAWTGAVGPARQGARRTGARAARRAVTRRNCSSTPPARDPTWPRAGLHRRQAAAAARPVRGRRSLRRNVERIAELRTACGDDFWLMLDCWMSLDLNYATRLAHALHEFGLKWIEEALPPDDYWGYAELRRKVPAGMMVTTGEHEATRWGFGCCSRWAAATSSSPTSAGAAADRADPIAALADAHNVLMVPARLVGLQLPLRGHAAEQPVRRVPDDVAEGRRGRADVPPLLLDEPVPQRGRMKARRSMRPASACGSTPEHARAPLSKMKPVSSRNEEMTMSADKTDARRGAAAGPTRAAARRRDRRAPRPRSGAWVRWVPPPCCPPVGALRAQPKVIKLAHHVSLQSEQHKAARTSPSCCRSTPAARSPCGCCRRRRPAASASGRVGRRWVRSRWPMASRGCTPTTCRVSA